MEENRSSAYKLSTLAACVGLLSALAAGANPALAQSSSVAQCLKTCRANAKACNTPVEAARKACAQSCRSDMKAALQDCPTADDPAACIGDAFAGAETCHDGCRSTAQADHGVCFSAANDCIKTCTPTQGDCIVGCRETTRNCRQAAYQMAYDCKANCRDILVTMLQGCVSDPNPGTCAQTARADFKSCRAPCLTQLQSDMADCKAQAKPCKSACRSSQ
jgi:hypothetical protein